MPFWDKVVPAKAASYFLSICTRLVDLAAEYEGVKTVVIGETGWATNGSDARSSEATPENLARYFHDFYQQTQEQNITYYYFSAFDESWKGIDTVEAYFGLLYEDGEMKPIIAEMELDDDVAFDGGVYLCLCSVDTDVSLSAVDLALEAADEIVAGESTASTVTDTSGKTPTSDDEADTTTAFTEEVSESTDSVAKGGAVANKGCAMI